MTKRKDPKDYLKRGRPTKYRDHFPQLMREYFDIPPVTIDEEKDEEGNITKRTEKVSEFPTLAGFCCSIGIDQDTMLLWVNATEETTDDKGNITQVPKYPEFIGAYKEAKGHQERLLVQNAITNRYHPTFSIFVAKNVIGYRDQVAHEHSGPNGKPIQTVTTEMSAEQASKVYGDLMDD